MANPPSMGFTLADIARLRKPEIPGLGTSARPALSAGAYGTYAGQQGKFEQLLQQMQPMAEMDAQMRMQAGQEYMDEAPMRRQNREFESSPEMLRIKAAIWATKAAQADREQLEAKAHMFAQLAKADPAQIPNILKMYGKDATFKGKDLSVMAPEELKQFSAGIIDGLKQTPKYHQAIDTQRAKTEGMLRVEDQRRQSRLELKRLELAVEKELEMMKELGRDRRAKLSREHSNTLEERIVEIQKALDGEETEEADKVKLRSLLSEYKQLYKDLKGNEGAAGVLRSLLEGKSGGGGSGPTPSPTKTNTKPSKMDIGGKIYDITWEGEKAYATINGKKTEVRIAK